MASQKRSMFVDGHVRLRLMKRDDSVQSTLPLFKGGIKQPEYSATVTAPGPGSKPNNVSIRPLTVSRPKIDSKSLFHPRHYRYTTLPKVASIRDSTACKSEEMRKKRRRETSSRKHHSLSSRGVASNEATPTIVPKISNEELYLPLVGQRSDDTLLTKKSNVKLSWQPKNFGRVGVAWGSVRRRRRVWSSACEDVEEEIEEGSSIPESVDDGEMAREIEDSEPENGEGFSVEELTDLEDDADTSVSTTITDISPPPLHHILHQERVDKDVATYVLLKKASQQLELLSIKSDSCEEDSDEEMKAETDNDGKTCRKVRECEEVATDKDIDMKKVEAIDSTVVEKDLVNQDTSPALTPSLFPGLEPTIHFPLPHEPYTPLPPSLRSLLKWKMSNITPNIIKGCLTRVGFTSCSRGRGWLGYWGKHMKSVSFRSVRSHQKVNHFPGTFEIGRKDRLWRNLCRLQARVGRKNVDFVPLTFVLPGDLRILRREWEAQDSGRQKWILKPPAAARGIGVRVVHKWNQIPKKRPLIVQRYIADPMLIGGNKFDLRVYVYVTSYDPLMIYVFPDGLTRFATCKYSASTRSLSNRFIHLTNYSVNKKNSQFSQNSDESVCQGHKWGLQALWRYMRNELGIDTATVWNSIVELVIKTIISSEAHCSSLVNTFVHNRYSCHELFGFDIILDKRLKPWLVEVNISPSLHSNSRLDVNIKGRMVRDLLNIAGFKLPQTTATSTTVPLSSSSLHPDKHSGAAGQYVLTQEERRKHSYFLQRGLPEYERKKILDTLTPGDIIVLMQAEDELSRRGMFERVFPSLDSSQYKKYFESEKYNNILLEQWMMKYQKSPGKGVELLRKLWIERHTVS